MSPLDDVATACLPGSHQEAARRLVDHQKVNSAAYRKRLLSAPLDGAHGQLLGFAQQFLKECQRRGWPMFVHCYFRGKEEQNKVNAQGHSKASWGQSPHNFGMAADIVHFGRFWDLTEKEWAVLGLVGKEVARKRCLKVTWGGDWKFYDPAHWELTDWKARRDLA